MLMDGSLCLRSVSQFNNQAINVCAVVIAISVYGPDNYPGRQLPGWTTTQAQLRGLSLLS